MIYTYPRALTKEKTPLYTALIGALGAIANEIFHEAKSIKMEIGEFELLLKMENSIMLAIFKNKLIPDESLNEIIPEILKVIKENKKDAWKYIDLHKVPDDVVCDCDICRKYSIREIKQLYSNGGEDFYFARILLYVHAIYQHIYLCERLQKDIEDNRAVKDLIEEIPDPELRNDLKTVMSEFEGRSLYEFIG